MNKDNNINYYDWKTNYNNMIYCLPDLMNYLKYGDEKMNEENIKDEIEKQIKRLDDIYYDIKNKLKQYYNIDFDNLRILRQSVEKNLEKIIGFMDFNVDIDNSGLSVYIKKHEKIINYIAKVVEIIEYINYELKTMYLDGNGLLLSFEEKQRVV